MNRGHARAALERVIECHAFAHGAATMDAGSLKFIAGKLAKAEPDLQRLRAWLASSEPAPVSPSAPPEET